MPPIGFRIDSIEYQVPFSVMFQQNLNSDSCYMFINTLVNDRIMLGTGFLEHFYHVYDIRRNQMALVPNSVAVKQGMQRPKVIRQVKESVIYPCMLALIVIAYSLWQDTQPMTDP